jgi:ribosomal protein S21
MSNIEIKRKKGETFEAMFRRFTRRIQDSGKVLTLRAERYHAKKPNRNRRRDSAVRRIEMGAKREYLLKTGKLVEEERRGTETRKN